MFPYYLFIATKESATMSHSITEPNNAQQLQLPFTHCSESNTFAFIHFPDEILMPYNCSKNGVFQTNIFPSHCQNPRFH